MQVREVQVEGTPERTNYNARKNRTICPRQMRTINEISSLVWLWGLRKKGHKFKSHWERETAKEPLRIKELLTVI